MAQLRGTVTASTSGIQELYTRGSGRTAAPSEKALFGMPVETYSQASLTKTKLMAMGSISTKMGVGMKACGSGTCSMDMERRFLLTAATIKVSTTKV